MTQIFNQPSCNNKAQQQQQQQHQKKEKKKEAQLVDGVGSYFKLNILRLE